MSKLAINGGPKIRTAEFPMQQDFGEEEKKLILEVLESKELSGFEASLGDKFFGGKKVKQLESLFESYYDIKHALAIQSASAGLHAAVAALDVNPGDEIIVTPYSMCVSATAAVMHKAIPIFVDIDEETCNLNPDEIRKAITPETKAIIIVHLFGYPADMDEIMAIAKEHNLKVIEDAAQAPGCKYKGKYVGTIGDMGIFSFNQNKTISTGEGGVVITNDDELAKRLELIRNHGEVVVDHYPVKSISGIVGYNYRMTELEAAVGVAQFQKLDKLNQHRIELADYLTSKLEKFRPMLNFPDYSDDSDHVYFVYPIKYNVNEVGVPRNKFVEAVSAEGFPIGAGYVRPIYYEPMYQQLLAYGDSGFPFKGPHISKEISYPKGMNPVCERMHFEELIITPICHYPLTRHDMDGFVEAIDKVLDNREELQELHIHEELIS